MRELSMPPVQRIALADGVHDTRAHRGREVAGGVDRGKDVLRGGTAVAEVEVQVLAVAQQAVASARASRCGRPGSGGGAAAGGSACPPGAGA